MKFVFLLLILVSSIIQAQNTFEIKISTDDNEEVYKGMQHPTGNYFITGRKGHSNSSYPYVIKVTPTGTYQEFTIVREDTNGFFPTLEFLENGNILLIGQCKIQDTLTYFDRMWLCELDTNLNIVRERTYQMLNGDYYEYRNWHAVKDLDNNIVIAGYYTQSLVPIDMVYTKISQNSDTLFTKSYHYQFGQRTGPIFLKPNGNYLSMVERVYLTDPISLVELDSSLEIVGISSTSSAYNDMSGMNLKWLNDSVYFRSSYRYDGASEAHQIGACLLDSGNQILKELIFDKPDTIDWPAWGDSHCYLNDTTIYICGFQSYLDFYVFTPSVVFLYLIDKDLNLLGELEFGGDVNYEMDGVTASNDGGCLIYGTTYDNPYGIYEYDVYIRKFIREEIVLITEVKENQPPDKSISVFPIPSSHYLNIESDISLENAIISIYEMSGRLVHQERIEEGRNDIDISGLNAGIYIYQIQVGSEAIESGKFIKL